MGRKMESPIENVVVLMLENRSFDHLLGFLPREGHLADLEGLTGEEYNLFSPFNPSSERVPVKKGALYEWHGVIPGGGPAHNLPAANQQLCGSLEGPSPERPALCNGFVASFADSFAEGSWNTDEPPASHDQIKAVMECFTPDQVPAISTLAREFVLCDHWFSSVPGPTMPNRLYVHAATSAGFAHNAWSHDWHFQTIYNRMADAGYSWGIYYGNDDVAVHFKALEHDDNQLRHFDLDFARDVERGELPNYSFIIPRFIAWNHPDYGYAAANSQHAPSDIRPGEELIALVYKTLRSNEEAWRKTLFVLVYDEHGGYYDHVVPPDGVPNPDGIDAPTAAGVAAARKAGKPAPPSFDFTRLGFRVPAILVSPWLPPTLDQNRYEHASLPATAKELFGLSDYLTARDRAANSFAHHLTGDLTFRDDTPEQLPTVPLPDFERAALSVQRNLDGIQRDIIEGTIRSLDDAQRRKELLIRLTAGDMTQQEAAAIQDEVIEAFKAAQSATGGEGEVKRR